MEIVDDNVNEAPEEFLLYLNIQNSDTVDTIITRVDRNPTRCRIMIDDGKFGVFLMHIKCHTTINLMCSYKLQCQ